MEEEPSVRMLQKAQSQALHSTVRGMRSNLQAEMETGRDTPGQKEKFYCLGAVKQGQRLSREMQPPLGNIFKVQINNSLSSLTSLTR